VITGDHKLLIELQNPTKKKQPAPKTTDLFGRPLSAASKKKAATSARTGRPTTAGGRPMSAKSRRVLAESR
jgi:hypothetical protein